MAMQKTTITLLAVLVVAVVAASLVSASLLTTRNMTNSATVVTVGVDVFWDSGCTNQTTSINWGSLAAGSVTSYTLYVKNNGTAPLTLTIAYGTWSPGSASIYVTPGWNCTNYVLGAGLIVAAVFTLTVSSSITGITNFSYTTTITGTG